MLGWGCAQYISSPRTAYLQLMLYPSSGYAVLQMMKDHSTPSSLEAAFSQNKSVRHSHTHIVAIQLPIIEHLAVVFEQQLLSLFLEIRLLAVSQTSMTFPA